VPIATAEENRAGGDRGGARDAYLVVDFRVVAGLELPYQRTGCGIQRVQIAVPASDIDDAIGDRRRGVHDVAGLELPAQRASSHRPRET
jgi:hypothetical protein